MICNKYAKGPFMACGVMNEQIYKRFIGGHTRIHLSLNFIWKLYLVP